MNILRHVDLTRIFFVDIETVPGHATHAKLPEAHQPLWEKFCEKRHTKELAAGQTHAELFANGGLYAEFGKIVCISVGWNSGSSPSPMMTSAPYYAASPTCLVSARPTPPAAPGSTPAAPMVSTSAPTMAASSTTAT
jgi:hypothetical protein